MAQGEGCWSAFQIVRLDYVAQGLLLRLVSLRFTMPHTKGVRYSQLKVSYEVHAEARRTSLKRRYLAQDANIMGHMDKLLQVVRMFNPRRARGEGVFTPPQVFGTPYPTSFPHRLSKF